MHAHVVFEADESAAMNVQQPPTPAGLRALLADLRLDRLAAIVIAPAGQPDRVTALNDRLLALMREEPRLFAVASVHPLDGERALAEVARVQAAGARMLKLHQNSQRFDLADPAVAAVVAQAGTVGLPVLFEGTSVLDPGTVGKFVKQAPSRVSASGERYSRHADTASSFLPSSRRRARRAAAPEHRLRCGRG